MHVRLGPLIGTAALVGVTAIGCTRENPAFDDPSETEGQDTDSSAELPADTGEEAPDEVCDLVGGMDMTIKVPQPCGETNDSLGVYEHWFKVVEASGSTWSVQFCPSGCEGDCEPVPGDLVVSPLPVVDLAGPETCLLLTARRLGSGDDCDYHTLSIRDMSSDGSVLVLARRSELLDLPAIDPSSGLAGFEPGLVEADSCDCAVTPDACCEGQAPTLYSYEINGTVIPVGDTQTVTLGQQSYDFWAFDAFSSGACDAPINLTWALVVH